MMWLAESSMLVSVPWDVIVEMVSGEDENSARRARGGPRWLEERAAWCYSHRL
jgi:hypothetical protein